MAELTTKEASERYDLSTWRIIQLVNAGLVKGRRFGHAWMIDEESLAEYVRTPHKPGPKKKRRQQPEPENKRRAVA